MMIVSNFSAVMAPRSLASKASDPLVERERGSLQPDPHRYNPRAMPRRSSAPAAFLVVLLVVLAGSAAAASVADYERSVEAARKRWAESPHGPMLERILPPTFAPAQLPQPASRGAALVVQYCVQCHNLPNPAMHDGAKWPGIVERMVVRMRGRGNMGDLMAEMMAGVQAPSDDESKALLAYLQRYSQRALDPKRYPDVESPAAQSFRLACNQCHVLPDPQRHTAAEWPAVVRRMERNMEWMNRVVGTRYNPFEPQLRTEEILRFLQRHARRG
jgi:cytochrome c5